MGLIDQSKDSASRKSFLIFLTKIISTIINVVGFYFVANYLGPEVRGTVVFAGGFIGLFSFLVDPGLNITHIKNLAQGQDIGKCNGIYFSLKAYLILLTVLVIIVAYCQLNETEAQIHKPKIVHVNSNNHITFLGDEERVLV